MSRLTASLAFLILAPFASAADWPQWMGPNRDNVWSETGILDKFPDRGPKILWRSSVKGGYAGPAVAGGKVFCSEYSSPTNLGEGNFGRTKAQGVETLFALDEATGKRLWEQSAPVTYGISYPSGPRCTPIVDGKIVIFLGAEGRLTACDTETGKIVWQKELREVYKTESALWGYAAHPLILGDKLITLAGGEGSHVVALDKKTGQEIWRSQTQPEQGYSPPLLIEAAGVKQLIVTGPKAIRGLNPDTGERLWTTPYYATSGSIIMTPIRLKDYLFIGGYSDKNLLLKLTADKPGVEVVAQDVRKKFLSPVNVQPMVIDGIIYGFDGSGELYGVELPSGDRVMTTTEPIGPMKLGTGTAFLVKQSDRVWFFNEKGEFVIGKLSPKGYEEIDRAKVLEPTATAFGRKVVWSMPAYANKKAFVRNDNELICVDLAK